MMSQLPTIAVVNGEKDWQEVFPDAAVRQCRLQTAQWHARGSELWLLDEQGRTKVDGVLWRVGAIPLTPLYRAVLDLIRLTGTPCVNPAATLLRGFDRLSTLAEMQQIGLPLLPQDIVIGADMLERLSVQPPSVVKVGNYHAGYGKALAPDLMAWTDLRDLAYAAADYVTVEPYIDYVRDLRCLAVGEDIWCMERRSGSWKANRDTEEAVVVTPPEELLGYTRAAMHHLNADILGLDFLEDRSGRFFLLETNDIPGLAGFPGSVRDRLAARLLDQLR